MAIQRIGKGFDFSNKQRAFEKFKRDVPKVIANNSKNWFLEGFRKGGFQTDASKTGWERRNPKSKRNTGRGILVDTGALRRSIQVISQTWSQIIIGTQRIPYADRHNEGLTDDRGRKMPKREFIGDSKGLDESNKKLLARMVGRIFR
jgi:hypothetical protein